MKNKKALQKAIGVSLMAAGFVLAMPMGGVHAEGESPVNTSSNVDITKGDVTNVTGTGYFLNSYSGKEFEAPINNNLTNNTINAAAGAWGMQYFYNCHPLTLTGTLSNNTINAVNYDANGGAIMIKGTEVTFKDAVISNNKVIAKGPNTLAAGGAIYADAAINTGIYQNVTAVIKATEDKTYSGNTVLAYEGGKDKWYNTYGGLAQSSGGFLFLDRDAIAKFDVAEGATLTIGEANTQAPIKDIMTNNEPDKDIILDGKPGHIKDEFIESGDKLKIEDTNADSIASALMIDGKLKGARLVKLGDGKLVVNGDMNKYYGSLDVQAGEMVITKDVTFTNTVNVGFEESPAVLTLGNATINSLANVLGKEAVDGKISIEAQVPDKHETTATYNVNDQKGLLYIDDNAIVNADNLNVVAGTVELQGGTLNVGKYTGALDVTEPNSAINADTIDGRINVYGSSSLAIGTLNNDNVVIDATGVPAMALYTQASGSYVPEVNITAADTVKLVNDENDNFIARIDGGKVNITAQKLEQKGSGHGLYVCDTNEGQTSLDINVDEYDVETKYSAIHLRNGNGDGVVNLNAKTITAKATTKEDGVALFQVNENNTMNITADNASLIGSDTSSGGVLGSGAAGTLNLTVADELKIDGNICGSYGAQAGEQYANDKFEINVNAGKLDMKGHINAGSIKQSGIDKEAIGKILPLDATNTDPAGWSNFSRSTEINVNAEETEFAGTINAFNKGTINANLGKAAFAEGSKVRAYANGTVNLAGDIIFADTELAGSTNGAVNLAAGKMGGTIAVNGTNVNLTGAEFAAETGLSNITGSEKLNLTGLGVLKVDAADIFSQNDVTSAGDNTVVENAKSKINFIAGSVALNDDGYTLDYVDKAKAALASVDAVSDDKQATSLVMLGKLKAKESDKLKDSADVEQLASIGQNVEFDKLQANTDGKNLTIGSASNTADAKYVTKGFSVKSLAMGDGRNVNILGNQTLTLGGSEGGSLVDANNAVDFNIGGESTSGKLNIGNSLAKEATEYSLNGNIKATNGDIDVKGQLNLTGNLELTNSALNIQGAVNSKEIKFAGENDVHGDVTSEKLTGAAKAILNVGNENAKGKLSVRHVSLQGGTMFIDPAWKDGVGISGASNVAVGSTGTGGNAIDGHYVVGQNSILAFGTTDNSEAEAAFAETGLTWGPNDITAAAFLKENIDLQNGSLVVDGSLTAAPLATANGTAIMEENSLLIVDGSKINGNTAAISNASSVTLANNAKLYIQNAKKGETYNVFGNATTNYDADNILTSNALIKFTANNGSVSASYDSVKNVLGNGIVIGNVVDNTLDKGQDGQAAYDFINKAVDDSYNSTKAAKAKALNSVANMGEMAGVSHGTFTASNMVTDAINRHSAEQGQVWAEYIRSKENVRDQKLAGVTGDYDATYNGIVVGADLFNSGNTTAGMALAYADGKFTSSVKNDAGYYGVSMYGTVKQGDTDIKADISYLHGDNDVVQHNSGTKITADANTDAFSVGVKAEHKLAGGFTPYVGARYMHLGTGSYKNSLGMEYDVEAQNIFLVPIGVTYTKAVKRGDWTLKPIAEAGYVWNMGDKDTDMTVSLNGAADSFGYQVVDDGSFVGRFGIEAEKANIRYALGYEYQKSDAAKHNKWTANVNFAF